MTLLLTQLTPEGIILGSDSALTLTTEIPVNNWPIINGVQKIYPIPSINAAISCWGAGWATADIETSRRFWIDTFIRENSTRYSNVHEFAILLRDELNRRIQRLDPPTNLQQLQRWRFGTIGAHLVGYEGFEGIITPILYHIHNGISEVFNVNPSIVNANLDITPEISARRLESQSILDWPLHRNGDFWLYANLEGMIESLFQSMRVVFILPNGELFRIPSERHLGTPLGAYSRYIRFWIQLIIDIVSLSNHPRTIGGEVQILTLTPNGEFHAHRP